MKFACKIVLCALGSIAVTSAAQQTVTTQGGTINNIPKYSGATTLSPSALTELNGNVGINNSNPQYSLDVVGSIGMGIRLMDTYGFPEFVSTSSITFAGSEQPTGYASITSAGTPWNYGDGYLSFATQTSGTLIPKMFLSPQGNLGIGSFAYDNWPQGELSIVTGNAGSETGEHIFNTDPTGYSALRLGTDDLGANTGAALHQFNSSWSGDPLGVVPPLGTTLAAFQAGGLILGTWDTSAAIKFFTSVNTGAENERMRITSAGSVGIGTTTPNSTLQVVGNISSTSMSTTSISFPDGSSQSTAYVPSSSLSTGSNGNVGIGTTNPQETLQVVSPASALATNGGAFGNGNLLIQAAGPRSMSSGAALSFAMAANLDGSNIWEQGRIITTADNTQNAYANGRMSLQTRFLNGQTWDWNNNLVLTSTGSIGVNVVNPGADLAGLASPPSASTPIFEVRGDIALSQNTAGQNTGGSVIFSDGTVQSTAWNGTTFGGDYAESIDVQGDRATYQPGDVIVIDESTNGKFEKSNKAYSRMVAGVYSTKPGLVGRRTTVERPDKDAEVPMAMMGIVPTKVSTENGPIARGDLLVSSSTPGYAMKGTDRDRLTGAVLGKALAPLASGNGIIEVLLALQ